MLLLSCIFPPSCNVYLPRPDRGIACTSEQSGLQPWLELKAWNLGGFVAAGQPDSKFFPKAAATTILEAGKGTRPLILPVMGKNDYWVRLTNRCYLYRPLGSRSSRMVWREDLLRPRARALTGILLDQSSCFIEYGTVPNPRLSFH